VASQFPPLVVMGVSGSGKSTVGAALGRELSMQFIDGDDLHPSANKDKMAAGHALNDDDRAPWLEIIADRIGSELAAGNPIIVACSALKLSCPIYGLRSFAGRTGGDRRASIAPSPWVHAQQSSLITVRHPRTPSGR